MLVLSESLTHIPSLFSSRASTLLLPSSQLYFWRLGRTTQKIRGSRRTCTCHLLGLMKFNTVTQNKWYMEIIYHFREQLCEIGKCLCCLIFLIVYSEEQEWLVITSQSRIALDRQSANLEWKSVNLCRKPWFPGLGIRRKQNSAYSG